MNYFFQYLNMFELEELTDFDLNHTIKNNFIENLCFLFLFLIKLPNVLKMDVNIRNLNKFLMLKTSRFLFVC
jgi:hypothetical protein